MLIALSPLSPLALLWLGGCTTPLLPGQIAAPPAVPAAATVPAPAAVAGPVSPSAAPPADAPRAAAARPVLAAPQAARNWDEFQLQAARRLVLANPSGTYLSAVPDPLLAIPVLEVELNEDGQVRHIRVKRVPSQATDTVQLAIAAVHRAAPYGSMKHLDKPWTFVEVFLFDDERRFKPRTLDP